MIEALEKINETFVYFPPDDSNLIQPCDSFVIQKLERAWTIP